MPLAFAMVADVPCKAKGVSHPKQGASQLNSKPPSAPQGLYIYKEAVRVFDFWQLLFILGGRMLGNKQQG